MPCAERNKTYWQAATGRVLFLCLENFT